MHRTEARDLACCSDCGAEIHMAQDRTYAFGAESVLCFACAIRRGGSYDEQHDVWQQAPELGDLARPDELERSP